MRLDLRLFPHQPIPPCLCVRQFALERSLRLSRFLQTALRFGQLGCPGGHLLSDPSDALACTRGLLPSLLKLATQIGQLLPPCRKGLLSGRDLAFEGGQTLLGFRHLFLEIRKALCLRFEVARDLAGLLLGCLQSLLEAGQLCLSLLP